MFRLGVETKVWNLYWNKTDYIVSIEVRQARFVESRHPRSDVNPEGKGRWTSMFVPCKWRQLKSFIILCDRENSISPTLINTCLFILLRNLRAKLSRLGPAGFWKSLQDLPSNDFHGMQIRCKNPERNGFYFQTPFNNLTNCNIWKIRIFERTELIRTPVSHLFCETFNTELSRA